LDTEAIASEIVYIKSLLDEMRDGESKVADTERKQLHDRMLHLQDQLADKGPGTKRGLDAHTDKMQLIPPT